MPIEREDHALIAEVQSAQADSRGTFSGAPIEYEDEALFAGIQQHGADKQPGRKADEPQRSGQK